MSRLVRLEELATVRSGMGMSGRAAGSRPGDWEVAVFTVGSIQNDRLSLASIETARIESNERTEEYLVRPDDVLVGARTTAVKAAYVPPHAPSRAVADATLLIVRSGMIGTGLYLWWYLTSTVGKREMATRMVGASLPHLPAKELAEIAIPIPTFLELQRLNELIEASEKAYVAATEAATIRRTAIRDAVVDRLRDSAGREGDDLWH
jgi:hypothetical protein